jgi:hypothetical protein
MSTLSGSTQNNRMFNLAQFRWMTCLALLLPCLAFAHGLLLDAKHVNDKIEGTVYYSNGELAVRESVELLDLTTANGTPVAGETDDDGKFSFPVTAGHRYRVSAYAAEGHGVDIELDAAADARPQLIENEAAAQEQSWLPPAWAVIGLLLLASMVPVVISRRRNAVSSNTK